MQYETIYYRLRIKKKKKHYKNITKTLLFDYKKYKALKIDIC